MIGGIENRGQFPDTPVLILAPTEEGRGLCTIDLCFLISFNVWDHMLLHPHLLIVSTTGIEITGVSFVMMLAGTLHLRRDIIL